MCTVSFYRDSQNIIITHNRDEHVNRPIAIPPKKILLDDGFLFCPIDPKSQGTWFVVKNEGNVMVLLNGAESKHIPSSYYRKSRGLILLELASYKNLIEAWIQIELIDIEPFTLVAFYNHQLYQFRWNGLKKSSNTLNSEIAHIWSSSTLYSPEIRQIRENWFSDFLRLKKTNEDDFLAFHSTKNDAQNGLIINRNQTILTKNITQCILTKNHFKLKHFDLINEEKSEINESIKAQFYS